MVGISHHQERRHQEKDGSNKHLADPDTLLRFRDVDYSELATPLADRSFLSRRYLVEPQTHTGFILRIVRLHD